MATLSEHASTQTQISYSTYKGRLGVKCLFFLCHIHIPFGDVITSTEDPPEVRLPVNFSKYHNYNVTDFYSTRNILSHVVPPYLFYSSTAREISSGIQVSFTAELGMISKSEG